MDEEQIRRFANRIDKALDNAARAGVLSRSPRFCLSPKGEFFATLNEQPEHWGVLSVTEMDLQPWLSRRWTYDWLDWPRTLVRMLSKVPSTAALDIARALVEQRRGHAGRYPPRFVPLAGGLADVRAPNGKPAWWESAFAKQHELYFIELAEKLEETSDALGRLAAHFYIATDDLQSFDIAEKKPSERLTVLIRNCIDLRSFTLWRRSMGFSRKEGMSPFEFFNCTNQYDYSPSDDLGTYAICALEAEHAQRTNTSATRDGVFGPFGDFLLSEAGRNPYA